MNKINQETAQQIIDLYVGGQTYKGLASKFNLYFSTIAKIVHGKIWKQCVRPSNIKEITNQRQKETEFKIGRMEQLHASYPPLTTYQKDIINGSLLGDGTIKKFDEIHPNSNFCKLQCARFKEYTDWHYEVLKPYSSCIVKHSQEIEGRIFKGFATITHHHPVFTEYRKKWYPNGTKIVPEDLELNPLIIAIWFFDDGNNSYSKRQVRFYTQGFQVDEADFLAEKLKCFEIKSSVLIRISRKTGKKQPYLSVNGPSYDNLINLIAPHCKWKCFEYKVKHRKAIKQWEQDQVKLSEDKVRKIFLLKKDYTNKEIARKFTVHHGTISRIINGGSWKHLNLANK
jgi:hypothetical protein